MLVTNNWIEKKYNYFNKKLFDNKLPDIRFKVSKTKHAWGKAKYTIDYKNNRLYNFEIQISNYYDSPEDVKERVLIHEMIHIADYHFHPEHFISVYGRPKYNAHGKVFFMKEVERIKKLGYDISPRVSTDDMKASSLTEYAKTHESKIISNKVTMLVKGDLATVLYLVNRKDNWLLDKVLEKPHHSIGKLERVSLYNADEDIVNTYTTSVRRGNGYYIDDEERFLAKHNITCEKVINIK